jgi:hypothetical protein
MSRTSATLQAVLASAISFVSLGTCLAANQPPLMPLAHFRFDGNAKDQIKGNADFVLTNTDFKDNALYLNGEYQNPLKLGYYAVCATPKLDYARFTVALRFKAEEFSDDKTNLKTNLLTGGTAYRWFGLNRSEAGNLTVTLNNQDYAREIKDASIEEGKWTVVACGVDIPSRKIVVYLNGRKIGDVDLPKNFKLRVVDSDSKDADKQWSFTNYSNGNVFHGLVDELMIFAGMLSDKEFANIPLRP